jgi:hypothetical protein
MHNGRPGKAAAAFSRRTNEKEQQMHGPLKRSAPNFQPHPSRLGWRRDGIGWLLVAGRRRFGRVVPDPEHASMWRSSLGRGELADMANLSWAKNAVLIAAERELEFEDRRRRAKDPSKCPERERCFSGSRPPMRQKTSADVRQPKRDGAAP